MRDIKFRAWEKEKMNVRKGSKGMYKQNGYMLAKAEYHPHANKRGYVPLHRLLMENELGRYLIPREELVHHIDGDRLNNDLSNLKLTTPQEHYIDEHFEKRNPNGRFVANEPIFGEIKYRLFDRDKNITQIYTLQELISKTYRRAKFKFRGRFTGLKDNNGTEIYEGDVVEFDGNYEVRFGEHGVPSLEDEEYVDLANGFYLKAQHDLKNVEPFGLDIPLNKTYALHCKVIGNVWEKTK